MEVAKWAENPEKYNRESWENGNPYATKPKGEGSPPTDKSVGIRA